MTNFCLLLSRFCLTAWTGAALFFVVILVDLRQSPLFDEPTKTNHAKVLFPAYYAFEAALGGTAFLATLAAYRSSGVSLRRKRWQLALLIAASLVATVDYVWIYLPLSVMVSKQSFPREFQSYHRASMTMNAAVFALWLACALLALWPRETE